MHAAIRRPYATGGIALVGASVIAVSPIAPPLPDIHLPNQHELQAAAVRLTAGWNPLTAWQNAFNTASANASTLTENFLLAPGVGLQQAIVNEVGFLKEVINDPSSIGTVLTQIANNAQTVASGLTGVGASAATNKAAQAHSVDALHGALASLLPTMLPPGTDVAAVTQVLNVLESPAERPPHGRGGPRHQPRGGTAQQRFGRWGRAPGRRPVGGVVRPVGRAGQRRQLPSSTVPTSTSMRWCR